MTKKALIIDDEAPLREIIRTVLSRLDIECIMAEDGITAVGLSQTEDSIDLIIIDMNLPGMNGEDAYSEIQKIHPHAGVIFISGYDMSNLLEEMHLTCPNYFLKKPFSIASLSKSVSEMLSVD